MIATTATWRGSYIVTDWGYDRINGTIIPIIPYHIS